MTRAEVLVIGAGPAGIAAATAAATNGSEVIVLDDNLAPGGQIWRASIAPANGGGPRQRALDALRRSGAQVLNGRSVFTAAASGSSAAGSGGAAASGIVQTLEETTGRVEEFRFDKLILATGARERFLPFPGWTLPGVLGAGGLQALVRGGYSVAGKRVVVAGTGPLLLAVAAHLAADGATIATVLEQASLEQLGPFVLSLLGDPAKLLQAARYRRKLWRTPYRTGCWVVEAVAGSNGQSLAAVRITDGSATWTEPCDLLAFGYHLVPNTQIAELLGCALRGSFVEVDASQRTSLANVFCAGEPTGIAGLEAALLQGEIAGLVCAGRPATALHKRAAAAQALGVRMEQAFALRDELRSLPRADTLVCRCEDVPFGDLEFRTGWTDAKLQTRCGMGPCQGRVCGPAVEHLLGWRPVSVRQPLSPVPLEALCVHGETAETSNNR